MTFRVVQVGDHQAETSWQPEDRKRHNAVMEARRKTSESWDRASLLFRDAGDFFSDVEVAIDQMNLDGMTDRGIQLINAFSGIVSELARIRSTLQEICE